MSKDAEAKPLRPLLIAIDGPAGSGKSTLARGLAGKFGLSYIETGAMYRALALKAISRGVSAEDEKALDELLDDTTVELEGERVLLDGLEVTDQIRSREVSDAASIMAENPRVRSWCVERQRSLALAARAGAVLEGRDIGTVVLPAASVKIFLTADLHERARRRAAESHEQPDDVLEKVRIRDQRDSERKSSPLVAADDAVVIDTTGHSADEVLERAARLVNRSIHEPAAGPAT